MSSAPRRDRLRGELQRLRDLAGLSGRELAAKLDTTQATVSRIERGQSLPSPPTVRDWIKVTGADAAMEERLLDLVEAILAETRDWGELLGDVGHAQQEAQDRERDAVLIRNFQPTVVPGLLQTPEYMRAVLSIGRTRDVEAAVAMRVKRQQALYEQGRRFRFVLGEHVLSRPFGGRDVLTGQLDRLVSLARLDAVDLAILPATFTAANGWSNFILWTPSVGEVFVSMELTHGAPDVFDTEGVALYETLWERMWSAAAVGDDAVALIRAMTEG